MEAAGVVLIVFGPIAGFLLLLAMAIRRLRPQQVDIRRWNGPAKGGGPAGDREPRRPLMPTASGAVRLPLPVADDVPLEPAGPVWVTGGPADDAPGHRVAG